MRNESKRRWTGAQASSLFCALVLSGAWASAQDSSTELVPHPPAAEVEEAPVDPVDEPPPAPQIDLEPPPSDDVPGEDAAQPTSPTDETEPAADAEDSVPPGVSGAFWGRFRSRRSNHEADEDVFLGLMLRLDVTSGVEVFFKGDVFVDAGRTHSDKNRLADTWDTWDSSAQGRLQEGYLRLTELAPGLDLRLGRQLLFSTRTLQFDGVSASVDVTRAITLRAHGGIPVYFYKSPWRGDVLAGGGLDFTPTASTRASLDYLHVTENTRHRRGYVHDDLFTLSVRQRVSDWATLRGRGEVLDDEVRSAEGSVVLSLSELGVQLRGLYYVLFDRQEARSNDLDPFSAVIGPENPHQRVEASLWKGFFDGALELEGFYTYRRVSDDADETLWNRDFHRYGASATVNDVPLEGLSLSFTWENWSVREGGSAGSASGDRGNDFSQASGELRVRLGGIARFEVGSSFLLYTYDEGTERVRENVRLYFARVRLRVSGHRLDLAYEFEDDDIDDFHLLRLGYRYEF